MGIRGYILIKLHNTVAEDKLWEYTRQFESVDGIEYAANVVGDYDFVVTIDTRDSVDSIVSRISEMVPDSRVETLKINNLYDKHREIKGLKIFEDLD